jgi:putative transposase
LSDIRLGRQLIFEGGHSMPRGKKHGAEEIIPKLREAEIVISQGGTNELAAKQIGVSVQTFLRWRKEYGGLRMDQAKRLKELEKENGRLKRLLADAELDKAILKEAASGNF